MLSPTEVDALAASARAGTLEVPGVVFAAVGCGIEKARAALDDLPDIAVTHDNCPHQVIVCGVEASVNEAVARLRKKGVLGQVLPFRSGFHSPLFAPYLNVHTANFARLAIDKPSIPVWSATTCEPFPDDADDVRALCIRHLVEPVRFRELIEEMYAAGARVFVQVGPGSLTGFVEDTLRGRPHLALAVTDHEDIARASAAVWCEGGAPHADAPRPAPAPIPRGTMRLALSVPLHTFTKPIASATTTAPGLFGELLADIGAAAAEVTAMIGRRRTKVTRRLSVETHPWLLDHTFMRQPPGWPSVPDRHPVVPMTTTVQMMIDEACALSPGKIAVEVRDVRAFRWLAIPQPTDVVFDLALDGDTVKVSVEGFAEATVILGTTYPKAPPQVSTRGTRAPRVDAERLYADRWMFHGPAFQGVRTLGPFGDSTARGTIETGAAPGALLDNAGQIYGYWVMETATRDRLAMPVGVERIRFFAPHPRAGAMIDCDVTIRALEERRVVADLQLYGWCEITGWEDRRFDTDDRLWDVLIWPEHHSLSANLQDFVLFEDTYRAAPTREQLMRRYLGERERALYESEPPRGQRAHLAGRIAAKDAVRRLLARPMFPVEIEIARDPQGAPVVRNPDNLHVSIAHKDDLAVAIAGRGPVGIDLERIAPRGEGFTAAAFDPSELALALPGEDLAEWQTRLWAAKEAVGKRLGTGLQGAPKRLRVSDRTGTTLLCEGHKIETLRHGDHVIAWTRT
jgi:phosphopantetheinyl transferase